MIIISFDILHFFWCFLQIVFTTYYLRTRTNTADGLETLRTEVFTEENGARASNLAVPRVAVVITDGRSNINASRTVLEAQALRADGVTVYSVGIGRRIVLSELKEIASSPDNVMLLNGFDVTEFDGLRSRISADACVGKFDLRLDLRTRWLKVDRLFFSTSVCHTGKRGIKCQ